MKFNKALENTKIIPKTKPEKTDKQKYEIEDDTGFTDQGPTGFTGNITFLKHKKHVGKKK